MVTFLYSRLSRESVNDSSDSCLLLLSTDVADSEHAIKEAAMPSESMGKNGFICYLFMQRAGIKLPMYAWLFVVSMSSSNENSATPRWLLKMETFVQ